MVYNDIVIKNKGSGKMSKLDFKLRKLLPRSNKDLHFVNVLYCFLMNKKQKTKVLGYLELFNSADINITDEDVAEYIELVLREI